MKINIFLLLMIVAIFPVSCSSKDELIPDPPVVETKGLREVSPFPFGASLGISLLKTRIPYRNVVSKEFNSVIAENAMKIGPLHPSENTYFWIDADYLISFAKGLGIRIHGHTLIWHNSLPSWITNFQGDAAAWENMFKTHIQTVVTHFKGSVNNMVADFKTRGIPIHGIGLQLHTNSAQSDANLVTAINTAAQTGLQIHISELDISLNKDNNQSLVLTDVLSALQAAKYKVIVKTFAALPASQRYGITTWNVGDADSWIRGTYNRPDWPLPFDDNYSRKPAYQGILDGLK